MTSWSFAQRPFLIAGPCVIEDDELMARVADALAELSGRIGLPVLFKASFDKANRARLAAPRGPGLDRGLRALERVRARSGLPVLTDVHEVAQVTPVGEIADAIQIPAFLCRQTDLLVAAGATGRPVNVKKGQWLDPDGMAGAVEKVRAGARARHGGIGGEGREPDLAVTERGTCFGYGDLVVDCRNFRRMARATGAAVVFDATHAVQRPGQGRQGASGGEREHVPALLAAAAAAGADGFFLETHPDPARAPSDAATQWPLAELAPLVERAVAIWHAARSAAPVEVG